MARITKSNDKPANTSLVLRFAEKFGIDADKMITTLKATAFRVKDAEITNEQLAALMIVAEQYNLNPFTKELYAYPDKSNGIIPVVSVDGWARIINENPAFDGVDFEYSEKMIKPAFCDRMAHEWIECVLYRKDRKHPTRVREYIDEVYREPFTGKRANGSTYTVSGPWQTHTKRMHRHKALIQAARIAFGFAGIYDQDEAERIIEAEAVRIAAEEASEALQDVQAKASGKGVSSVKNKLAAAAADIAPAKIEQQPASTANVADVNAIIDQARAEELATA